METLGNISVTPAEAANIAGVSTATIAAWCNVRKLQSFRTAGGHRRILKSSLLDLLGDTAETNEAIRREQTASARAARLAKHSSQNAEFSEEDLESFKNDVHEEPNEIIKAIKEQLAKSLNC